MIRVLLVEDNRPDAVLLRETLVEGDAHGFEVVVAASLQDARTQLDGGRFDVALLDLSLPDSQGLSTLRAILAHTRGGIPVVVLSGLDDEELATQAVKAGAQDYLVKGRVGPRLMVRALRYATERHRLLSSLEERASTAETAHALMVQQIVDYAIFVVSPSGVVETWNQGAERVTGYAADEIVGRSFALFFSAEDRDRARAALQEALVEGRFELTAWHLRKNRSRFYGNLVGTALHDREGYRRGVTIVMRDVTERKHYEDALQATNRQLQETLAELQRTQMQIIKQERLHAVGQMASGIAHDFNNALFQILGFADLLLTEPDALNDTRKTVRYIEMIQIAARDAAVVVRRLRDFYRARDEAEILLPLDLNGLIEQVVSLTEPRWRGQMLAQGVTINVYTDLDNIPSVGGNEGELRDAFTNLIFNAVDAMPEGGELRIATRLERNRGTVVVEVTDTGAGMNAEVRARCFEPFFTTKGARGTGMGLAMVHGIIRRHDGELDLRSRQGEGTTIIIRLPVLAEHGPSQPILPTAQRRLQPLDILVVEDEPALRVLLHNYLSMDGHRVEVAVDGVDGLEKFSRGRFDVVITDRGMPRLSGDKMARSIKAQSRTPVIMLTGFGHLMEAAGQKPEGVDLLLGKPLTLNELRQALESSVPRVTSRFRP